VGRPWGFNHWAPQTETASGRGASSWWFKGSSHTFTWVRCTHQPSPWIGDWGFFLFTPVIGGGKPDRNPVSFWEPRGAALKPYLLDATIAPNNVRIELTPTDHAAVVRVTFPTRVTPKRVCFADAQWSGGLITPPGSNWKESGGAERGAFISGVTTVVHQDRIRVNNFKMHVHIEAPDATEVKELKLHTVHVYHTHVITYHISHITHTQR
jgi:hypothetical protein